VSLADRLFPYVTQVHARHLERSLASRGAGRRYAVSIVFGGSARRRYYPEASKLQILAPDRRVGAGQGISVGGGIDRGRPAPLEAAPPLKIFHALR